MATHVLRPIPRRISRRPLRPRRTRRRVSGADLISVAGVVGARVVDADGRRLGVLDDIVVHWDTGDAHPPVWGIVIRSHLRLTGIPAASIDEFRQDRVRLVRDAESVPVERAPGLVGLAHDVLDRQIVDVDGSDVVRVSDLVLARGADGLRLVGSDVSARTLFRRLGPAALRRRVAADRIYDWAAVAAFSVRGAGEAGSVLRLTSAARELGKLRPDEVHLLAGDLPPHERAQLAAHVAVEAK